MRSVRSVLLGLATLIVLLTFVGFATFAPDGNAPLSDVDQDPLTIMMAADAGSTTGRVTAFVFANQLLSVRQESPPVTVLEEPDLDLSAPTLLRPPTTSTSTSTTTQPPTTTTQPPTTTTQPPTTTTSTTTTTTTTTTQPPTTTTSTTTTTQPPTTTSTTTTTQPPTTTTTHAGGPLTETEMRNLAAQYFPTEGVDKAVLVAWCESRYDPAAYNPAGPYAGLYQHSVTYWDGRALLAGWAGASVYDPIANTAVTAWLVARDGWGHWPWCSAWADGQLGG